MEDLAEFEKYLIGQIEAIRRSYEKEISPYVDKLVRIRSMRPIPPVIIEINPSNREFLESLISAKDN